jgi:hypothetical protein
MTQLFGTVHRSDRIFVSVQPDGVDEMRGKAMLRRTNSVTTQNWLVAFAVGSAIAGMSIGSCRAQCVDLPDRASQADVQAFSNEPAMLLRQMRTNKEKLTGRLTGYLVTAPDLLPAVRELVKDTPTADRPAIGEALRRAELRCVATQPELARKINEFVRKSGDVAILSGYSAKFDQPEPPPLPAAKPLGSTAGLMSGQWQNKPADPFAPMPLPLGAKTDPFVTVPLPTVGQQPE